MWDVVKKTILMVESLHFIEAGARAGEKKPGACKKRTGPAQRHGLGRFCRAEHFLNSKYVLHNLAFFAIIYNILHCFDRPWQVFLTSGESIYP